MILNNIKKIYKIILISMVFLVQPIVVSAKSLETITLEDYTQYFYNRYSKHFDEYGWNLKTPGYGITEFTPATSPRSLMSIAVTYKYRAINNKALQKRLCKTIQQSDNHLFTRPGYTQSFEDAWAQLAMIQMLKQLPDACSRNIERQIYTHITARIKDGILAADTSNRAALSATYWQYSVNQLYQNKWIKKPQKQEYDALIKAKISRVVQQDITPDGWYLENTPRRFNPHYHLVTAFAFMAYGELTGNKSYTSLASKMTTNLRHISFRNGMVEASIDERPVGLGAQFYYGLGLLNYRFGYEDYGTYFNFAKRNHFFADPEYPNRLVYYSTVAQSDPQYHDDYAFTNIAELTAVLPSFENLTIEYKTHLSNIPKRSIDAHNSIKNNGDTIQINNLVFQQTPNGRKTKKTLLDL